MNWQEALEEIRSIEFDVSLNVVSGTNNYFRAAAQHPAVQDAYRQMIGSGELGEEAINLIYDLANEEVDPQFENPHDTPLAVLLWLVNFAAPGNVELAATYVDQAPYCWYSKKLAQRILNPPRSATANPMISQGQHEFRINKSSSQNVRSPTPLIPDAPRAFHSSNSQPEPSVVDTTWSSSSGFTAMVRGDVP